MARLIHVAQQDDLWALVGSQIPVVPVVNSYLGYLADRHYSPRTIRAYAFDVLHFVRWMADEGLGLDDITTDALLCYLAACRIAEVPARPGGNDISTRDRPTTAYTPTT